MVAFLLAVTQSMQSAHTHFSVNRHAFSPPQGLQRLVLSVSDLQSRGIIKGEYPTPHYSVETLFKQVVSDVPARYEHEFSELGQL